MSIKNEQDAKVFAEKIFSNLQHSEQKGKLEFMEKIMSINQITPKDGGFEEISVLLLLPEEQFQVLSPIMLETVEKKFSDPNLRMTLVQTMNLMGKKAEELEKEFQELCNTIDVEMISTLSKSKRAFLKMLFSYPYNALIESVGVAKKTILIPIEFCNENAKMPAYAHLTDSGMDVYALEDITIAPSETKLVPTGLKVAIPAGYELQVRPKSGRCLKTKLRVANTPGTIDAGYRDEIGVIIDNIEPFIKSAQMDEAGRLYNVEFGSSYTIGKGEKFAQLVLCEVPKAAFYQVESVATVENDGRAGGFGSTGVK